MFRWKSVRACHVIEYESKNPFHLSAARVILITLVIIAITIMHTNKNKLLWPKIHSEVYLWFWGHSLSPVLATHSHSQRFIRFIYLARFHSTSNKMPLWSIFHLIRCLLLCYMMSVCIHYYIFMVNEWVTQTHTHGETNTCRQSVMMKNHKI